MKLPRIRSCRVPSPQFAARIKSALKRSLWALILPCLLVGRAEAASIPIPNGNFEGLTGTLPTSWTLPYANGYEFSSTLVVHGGSRSLKIIDGGSATGAVIFSRANDSRR